MPLPQPPFDFNNPIPNNPFSSQETSYLEGPYYPGLAGPGSPGSNISFLPDGTIIVTGGTPGFGTVTGVTAGNGLIANGVAGGTITASGTIAMANTAVIPGSYTAANITVDATGRITAASDGSGGSVTQILTGTGLQGGPITSTGTISLRNTTVVPGNYTLGSFTVDAQGRLTAASSGTAVTSITAGTGLSGGTITTTGTISLPNTGVSAGAYANASITVDNQGRITAATANPAPVTTVTGTAPIISSGGTTPVISLQNSGVTSGSYTNSSITVDATGRVTAASSGTPPVTSVTGLSPIVSSGGATPQISLTTTPVTPGSYTYASLTVDGYGRLTAASSGTTPVTSVAVTPPIVNTGTAVAPVITVQTATTGQLGVVQVGTNIDVAAGVISVATADTTTPGIVQLNNTVASTSTSQALTAAQGKVLQDQIDALAVTTNLTLAGTFDAASGQMLSVTSAGTAAGFLVGNDLPSPAAGLIDYFVIVTTEGSYSPPGGGGPYTANQGDWFLCDGTVWQFLNVGTDLPVASTTEAGIVELADVPETQAGTDATRAVTPLGAASTYVPLASLTGKGALISASGAGVLETLSVGANGTVLVADSAESSGLKWEVLDLDYVPDATFTATGDLVVGTGPSTYTALPLGSNGNALVVNTSCAGGLEWVPAVNNSIYTAKGSVIASSAAATPQELLVGADGEVLTACAAAPLGVCWAPAATPSIPCACITGKGALVTGTAVDTPVALPVGADGDVLTACSASPDGLCWAPAATPSIPCACITGKGAIVTGTALDTPAPLSVGANGEVLTACDACAEGLFWAPPVLSATPTAEGVLYGCTCNAGNNTALGLNALLAAPTGTCNVSIGAEAGKAITTGTLNTFLGSVSGCSLVAGNNNLFVGACSGYQLGAGDGNVFVGDKAGCESLTGCCNVALGPNVQVTNVSGNCQLAIGFDSGCNWLTGDCDKNIRPGASIIDCLGCTGLYGQYLAASPDGTALQWSTAYGDTPVGAVQWFAGTIAPSGWVVADGRELSRASYSMLFSVIGETYGAGDGSTTFNVPDLRGQFIRGWDNAGGGVPRGCDPGRVFGTEQLDAFESHTHTTTGGAYLGGGSSMGSFPPGTAFALQNILICSTGGTETRPMNVAMLPCIKYEVTTAPQNPTGGIPCACITGKGAIITGTGANAPVALPVGTDGLGLIACSSCAGGLAWAPAYAGIPSWTDAGPIVFGATSTPPVPSNVGGSTMQYRQLGPKEWEVVMSFNKGSGGTGGVGDYVFTLPAGLTFDTSLLWQTPQSGLVGVSTAQWWRYMLPGPSQGFMTDGSSVTNFAAPVVFDATRFRIVARVPQSSTRPWGNGWFTLSLSNAAQIRFQFTSQF